MPLCARDRESHCSRAKVYAPRRGRAPSAPTRTRPRARGRGASGRGAPPRRRPGVRGRPPTPPGRAGSKYAPASAHVSTTPGCARRAPGTPACIASSAVRPNPSCSAGCTSAAAPRVELRQRRAKGPARRARRPRPPRPAGEHERQRSRAAGRRAEARVARRGAGRGSCAARRRRRRGGDARRAGVGTERRLLARPVGRHDDPLPRDSPRARRRRRRRARHGTRRPAARRAAARWARRAKARKRGSKASGRRSKARSWSVTTCGRAGAGRRRRERVVDHLRPGLASPARQLDGVQRRSSAAVAPRAGAPAGGRRRARWPPRPPRRPGPAAPAPAARCRRRSRSARGGRTSCRAGPSSEGRAEEEPVRGPDVHVPEAHVLQQVAQRAGG